MALKLDTILHTGPSAARNIVDVNTNLLYQKVTKLKVDWLHFRVI
jgi:hypothetical protein